MQQIAVNLGTKKGNGNVFSVNGPPGTGKTTLLKEIVAGNLIERAALLAEYEEPDRAFERHPFLKGEEEGGAYYKYVRSWNSLKDDRINGYGILVASCNNAAVENVTKELPLASGIRGALQPGKEDAETVKSQLEEVQKLFDPEQSEREETIGGSRGKDLYFTQYARNLLHNEDVWGLAAAPLGKRANVSDFYFHVLAPLQRDFYRKNAEIERRLETYQKERKAFLEQLETVKKMQQELQKLCDLAGRRRKTREENRLLQEKKQQRKEEYLAGRTRLGEEKKNLGQTLGRQEEQWKAALKNQEEFLRQVEEKQTQAEAAAAKKTGLPGERNASESVYQSAGPLFQKICLRGETSAGRRVP